MLDLGDHKNVALHFSGGKDSLAVTYLLREVWPRITLYHVDTGDLLPEVREIVDGVEAMVPRFVRINTDAMKFVDEVGLPSDLVPTSCTPGGLLLGLGSRRIIDRFDCCASNIMMPLHQRMVADGITLVIRGTKRADTPRMAHSGGDTGEGYDLWLPLIDWSHDEVFAYLRKAGAPICRVYEHKVNAPECARCTAWWGEGRAAYLGKYHPALYADYQARLAIVAREIAPHLQTLQVEHG